MAVPVSQARRSHQRRIAKLLDELEQRRQRIYLLQARGARSAGLELDWETPCGGTGWIGSANGTPSSDMTSGAAGSPTRMSAIYRSRRGSAISRRSSMQWGCL